MEPKDHGVDYGGRRNSRPVTERQSIQAPQKSDERGQVPDGLSATPESDRIISEHWSAYEDRVRARVEQGKRDYGDSSLNRPVSECLDELQQEIEDLNGWGFIIWARLEDIKRRLAASES